MAMYLRSVEWRGDHIRIVDQTELPHRLVYRDLETLEDVAEAIVNMRVRGAPLIGVVAALGLALEAIKSGQEGDGLIKVLERAYNVLGSTRPTAVNLFNAMDMVMERARKNPSVDTVVEAAVQIMEMEVENNRRIASFGAELIPEGAAVLTHCNTGSLAAVEIGTALGVIIEAYKKGRISKVFITETRPKLQGARLTAYELLYAGIKPVLIVDSAAPFLISRGDVDVVIVGADRILSDGTTFNKIGTYSLALASHLTDTRFYVAAPTTTFDLESDRDEVEIEVRSGDEIINCGGCRIAPEGVDALNLAFDATPPEFIDGIITEKGVLKPPFSSSIPSILESSM